MLGKTLDLATEKLLIEDKSPTRRLGGIDNRGSHYYLALYWAQALAAQEEDASLKEHFAPIAEKLAGDEETILKELLSVQGSQADAGGYYLPDDAKASVVMRPSATFNGTIDRS